MSRKKTLKKVKKIIESINKSTPKITFKHKNLTVTLKNKEQLKTWLNLYPDGNFVVNY
tara:strand:+ start:2138 stop:2311 length:174 start_codon:yes stop_codon:yes gene_type:complete